jgi:hypothetical protein
MTALEPLGAALAFPVAVLAALAAAGGVMRARRSGTMPR